MPLCNLSSKCFFADFLLLATDWFLLHLPGRWISSQLTVLSLSPHSIPLAEQAFQLILWFQPLSWSSSSSLSADPFPEASELIFFPNLWALFPSLSADPLPPASQLILFHQPLSWSSFSSISAGSRFPASADPLSPASQLILGFQPLSRSSSLRL